MLVVAKKRKERDDRIANLTVGGNRIEEGDVKSAVVNRCGWFPDKVTIRGRGADAIAFAWKE